MVSFLRSVSILVSILSSTLVASAEAATPAAELCLKLTRSRIMTPADQSKCQEKISTGAFDPGALQVCGAMIDLRVSTVSQVFSCMDVIRNKSYPNGTEVCLMMFNSLATTSAVTQCLANSGQVIPPQASTSSADEDSRRIERVIARIDAAIFQLDSDGANASTSFAVEQLRAAKNELLKLKLKLEAQ